LDSETDMLDAVVKLASNDAVILNFLQSAYVFMLELESWLPFT